MKQTIEKTIKDIDFGLLNPEMIREMSAVRVVVPDIYDDDGYPIEGGLVDPRMGVINPGLRCKTCGARKDKCPGHFGHIELIRPVVHIGYAKKIYNILRTTCRECGKILLNEDEIKSRKKKQPKGVKEKIKVYRRTRDKAKKKKKCPHCEAEQKEIKFRRPTEYLEDGQELRATKIRERFERVPDEHLPLLNVNPDKNRPEWFILTVLPVPPVTTRPSITLETGNRSEDDLTHKLTDILRANQRLADNVSAGAPQPIIEDLWDLLQYHITTYFDNETSGIPAARDRSGRSLKCLAQRIKGKQGRIRQNLTGKRVNFSGRAVISPDLSISIGEVGLPQAMAETFTVPIRVTKENLEDCKKYIENEEYPRAIYLESPEGERRKINEKNREELKENLQPGYKLERHIIDGDISIFNRQPSLHRQSMMSHKIKVMPGQTIRLNDGIAEPYNADYDGDAMNIHIPQTIEAQVEAEKLLPVKKNLICPRHGEALAGSHDNVTALAKITQEGTKFTKEDTLRLLKRVNINRYPEGKEKDEYTGKEVFSELIPNSINITIPTNLSEQDVKIENGKVTQGVIDEKTFGSGGKLIREIWDVEGPEAAEEFINQVEKFTVEALSIKGHTISLEDYTLPQKTKKELNKMIEEKENKAMEHIDKFKKGEIEPYPGKTQRETLEAKIMQLTGEISDEAWELAIEGLGRDSHGIIMALSGARGSSKNVTQMSCTVGQMGARGKRLSRGYKGRILPHYKRNTLAPQEKGYIPQAFKDGLTPQQLFQQSMSGRDSLIDKGINPKESGYMQRRMVNALLDLVVEQDGSVRNANKDIIQFQYGEDGIDPTKSRKKGINVEKIIEEVEK